MNQEFVRYTLTAGYVYLAWLALACPCDVILGCHAQEWLLASLGLSALVGANLYFGAPKP